MEHWVHAAAAIWSEHEGGRFDPPEVRANYGASYDQQLFVNMYDGVFGYEGVYIHFPFAWPLPGLDPSASWTFLAVLVRMASIPVRRRDGSGFAKPPGVGNLFIYERDELMYRRLGWYDPVSPPRRNHYGDLRIEVSPDDSLWRRPIRGPLSVVLQLNGVGAVWLAAVGLSFQPLLREPTLYPYEGYSYLPYIVGADTTQEDLDKEAEAQFLPEPVEAKVLEELSDEEFEELIHLTEETQTRDA